jgi:hydrogenase-4 component H
MGILGVLWRNALNRARTRTVADVVPTPVGFRGMIEHDASLCTGCRACAFVCAPKAISFDTRDGASIAWKFFAGQCSYCGLCVQYCPTHAITNRGKLPPVTGDASVLRVVHQLDSRPCSGCGRPVVPLPEAVLRELYAGEVTESVREQQTLCDACRRRSTGTALRDALLGPDTKRKETT